MVEIIVATIVVICFILWFDIEGGRNMKKSMRKIERDINNQ